MATPSRIKNYFNNQFIIENALEFKLIYSFAQAAMQLDIEYMESHTTEIEGIEASIVTLQAYENKLLEDPKSSMEDIKNVQLRIEFTKTNLEIYRTEVDELVAKYGAQS